MFILKLLVLIVVFILSALLVRTNQLLWTSDQTHFSSGTVSDPLPSGLYAGSVGNKTLSWKGKKFTTQAQTGINLFENKDGTRYERYPFTVSVGPGMHDYKDVIRIDYNLSENPFWLRPVLDELVQIAPDTYLGKLQLRVIPRYPFTLTYFKLVHSVS